MDTLQRPSEPISPCPRPSPPHLPPAAGLSKGRPFTEPCNRTLSPKLRVPEILNENRFRSGAALLARRMLSGLTASQTRALSATSSGIPVTLPKSINGIFAAAKERQPSTEQIVVADEASHECGPRISIDLSGVADLLDPAGIENRDAVGHRHRLGLIVRDVDRGHAEFAMDAAELDLHCSRRFCRARRAARRAARRRLEHQCPRQRDALLLAARQIGGVRRRQTRKARRSRSIAATSVANFALRDLLASAADSRHCLRDRHVRKQRVVLEHHADVAPVRRHGSIGRPANGDGAGGRPLEAAIIIRVVVLPEPEGPEKSHEFALRDLRATRRPPPRPVVIALDQIVRERRALMAVSELPPRRRLTTSSRIASPANRNSTTANKSAAATDKTGSPCSRMASNIRLGSVATSRPETKSATVVSSNECTKDSSASDGEGRPKNRHGHRQERDDRAARQGFALRAPDCGRSPSGPRRSSGTPAAPSRQVCATITPM